MALDLRFDFCRGACFCRVRNLFYSTAGFIPDFITDSTTADSTTTASTTATESIRVTTTASTTTTDTTTDTTNTESIASSSPTPIGDEQKRPTRLQRHDGGAFQCTGRGWVVDLQL